MSQSIYSLLWFLVPWKKNIDKSFLEKNTTQNNNNQTELDSLGWCGVVVQEFWGGRERAVNPPLQTADVGPFYYIGICVILYGEVCVCGSTLNVCTFVY